MHNGGAGGETDALDFVVAVPGRDGVLDSVAVAVAHDIGFDCFLNCSDRFSSRRVVVFDPNDWNCEGLGCVLDGRVVVAAAVLPPLRICS